MTKDERIVELTQAYHDVIAATPVKGEESAHDDIKELRERQLAANAAAQAAADALDAVRFGPDDEEPEPEE